MGVIIEKHLMLYFRVFNSFLLVYAMIGFLEFSIKPLNAVHSFMFGLALSVLVRTRKIKSENLNYRDKQLYILEILAGSLLIGLSQIIGSIYNN